eukprot:451720-Pelagomonas_calceolata.AAC.3
MKSGCSHCRLALDDGALRSRVALEGTPACTAGDGRGAPRSPPPFLIDLYSSVCHSPQCVMDLIVFWSTGRFTSRAMLVCVRARACVPALNKLSPRTLQLMHWVAWTAMDNQVPPKKERQV